MCSPGICLTSQQIVWLILSGIGVLAGTIIFLVMFSLSFAYLKEKLEQGKRLIFRSPIGFGDKRVRTTKTKGSTASRNLSGLLTWILVMLIVVAIVVPTAILITQRG